LTALFLNVALFCLLRAEADFLPANFFSNILAVFDAAAFRFLAAYFKSSWAFVTDGPLILEAKLLGYLII
jgi:hypothetical protein